MPIVAHDDALERIISTSQPINELAGGFGGEQGPAEGPVWWQEEDYLLFSDIHNNRRMKWSESEGVSVFTEPHQPRQRAYARPAGPPHRGGA